MNTDPQTARPRLLIVEDDPSIQTVLRYFLSQRFDVEQALDVDHALETASHQHFDLFLLDMRLGEQRSGLDLLGLLRQMPAYRSTPAVVCSAYVDHGNERRYLREGFEACIPKPFKSNHLREIIDTVLEQRRRAA